MMASADTPPAAQDGLRDRILLTEVDRLVALIDDMAGPVVAWAQARARQAELASGTFNPHHQGLIDRMRACLEAHHGAQAPQRYPCGPETTDAAYGASGAS